MKRNALLLIPVILLTACGNTAKYQVSLKVAAPSGAPAIALYKYLGDTEHVEVGDATNVTGYFTETAGREILFAPTNFGVSAIKKGSPFKIAATVTFGNFYLVSTGNDTNGQLDPNDRVLAFQQNGVAGKLFSAVYGDLNLDVKWSADVKAAKSELLTNTASYDYALLAEPVLNAVLKARDTITEYQSVQTAYKNKFNNNDITQASIFINDSVDHDEAVKFLNQIEKDMKELLKNPSVIVKETSSLEEEFVTGKIGGLPSDVKDLIQNDNRLGIGFKKAIDIKPAIDAFMTTFGAGATSEEIYFN